MAQQPADEGGGRPPLPITVVVPTIGRPELLRACLESLTRCVPRAVEIVVVDQSRGDQIAAVVGSYESMGARRVESMPRGLAHARNVGNRHALHDLVLHTDDDCTVAEDWVVTAWEHLHHLPEGIVTGRVLAAGDAVGIPSTNDGMLSKSYAYPKDFGVLFTGNMCGRRSQMAAIGGFDSRLNISAEDNDFCHRWLRAGRTLRFEPDLVVWHHDWRTNAELDALYVRYAVGQGMVYAKHLWRGDRAVLRFLLRDLSFGLRTFARRFRYGEPEVAHWGQGLLRGLPRGLALGLVAFRPRRRSRRRGSEPC